MPTNPPEPWHSFLLEIDRGMDQTVVMQCIGGFVVTQLYGFQRPTVDLDVVAIIPRTERMHFEKALRGGDLHKKFGIYLDLARITVLPDGYEDRLTEMYRGVYSRLRFAAVDPYDLALSKIERNITRDREDMLYLARLIPFDLGLLKERYKAELRPYLNRPEREDLTLQLWIEAIEEDRGRGSA